LYVDVNMLLRTVMSVETWFAHVTVVVSVTVSKVALMPCA